MTNWKMKRRFLIARDILIAAGIGLVGIITAVLVVKLVSEWM